MVAGASGRRQNAAHFASNDAHHSGFQRRRAPDYMVLAGAAASSSHRDEQDPGTATSNASSPAQRLHQFHVELPIQPTKPTHATRACGGVYCSLRDLAAAQWPTTSITHNAEEELRELFECHRLARPNLVMQV
jgi:hypothetical protein